MPADTVEPDNAVFAALAAPGTLAAAAFAANADGIATDAAHRIVYETGIGNLFLDAGGAGGGAGIHFATPAAGFALTNADFVVV